MLGALHILCLVAFTSEAIQFEAQKQKLRSNLELDSNSGNWEVEKVEAWMQVFLQNQELFLLLWGHMQVKLPGQVRFEYRWRWYSLTSSNLKEIGKLSYSQSFWCPRNSWFQFQKLIP